jgi:hypothetical protein
MGKPTHEELGAALVAARDAASACAGVADSGSCNLDFAYFTPPRGLRSDRIMLVASGYGVPVRVRDTGAGRVVVVDVTSGQASRRTKMAEAAAAALKAHGLDAGVWYCAD